MILLKLLRSAIESILLFSYDTFEYVRDVWAVNFRQRHRVVERETKGEQARPAEGLRVAIVALYPTSESLPFTKNLLRMLHSNGFFVLAISTRKLPDKVHASILLDCHHLIERVGVGRDFGSYKMGIAWIQRQESYFSGIETLLLANDSNFVPKAFEDEFKVMLQDQAEWQCLFENFEFHYHAQSFFLLFRKAVFSNPAFRSFWKNYRPYSSRRHSINQGEVKLSSVLRRAGYTAKARYNSTQIFNTITSRIKEQGVFRIAELSPSSGMWKGSRGKILDSLIKSATANYEGAKPKDFDNDLTIGMTPSSMELKRWPNVICHSAETMNPTHGLALIANNFLAAPIKRDVCYRGVFDIAQILLFAHGFSDAEMKAMAIDLNQRGLPASVTGIRRLFLKYGRI